MVQLFLVGQMDFDWYVGCGVGLICSVQGFFFIWCKVVGDIDFVDEFGEYFWFFFCVVKIVNQLFGQLFDVVDFYLFRV